MELIFSLISIGIFLVIVGIDVFKKYGIINKKDKKIIIFQNVLLILLAITQVILMRYSNLSGRTGNFIAMYMAFLLLK